MAWPFDNQGDTQSVLPIDYGVQKFANYVNQNLGNNRNTNNVSLPLELMGGSTSMLDYGINTLANKFNNYAGSNRRLDYDEGLSGWGSPMGDVPDGGVVPPIKNINRPLNTLDPNWQHQLELQKRPDYEAPEKTGIFENLKSKFTTPTLALLKAIGGEMTPEKRAEVEAIRGSADKYGWGNLPGTDLQGNIWQGGSGGDKVYVRAADGTMIVRDKNLQSRFGSKTIADMIQKKEDWAKGQFEKYGDEWDDDEHRGLSTKLYNYYKSKGIIDKWKNRITTPIDAATTTDTVTGGTVGPNVHGGGSEASFTQRSPGGISQATSRAARTDQGGNVMSGWNLAQGGRIGYRDGEFVDEDINIEGPGYDFNENIEAVQGEPSQEQLEVIAFEIFRLPLEQLSEPQLEIVYRTAIQQEPSEEQVQLAAQEGPGEGIASLV
jgi:hypothetical protein